MRSRSSLPERSRLLAGCSSGAVGVALVSFAAVSGAASSAPGGDAQFAQGRALFTGGATPPCAVCHTLKDAGATGAVGPSLDELRPDEERVATAVRGGIGAMPSFAATLSDAQIRALARYVAKASGGAP
jgi:cytochrome c6